MPPRKNWSQPCHFRAPTCLDGVRNGRPGNRPRSTKIRLPELWPVQSELDGRTLTRSRRGRARAGKLDSWGQRSNAVGTIEFHGSCGCGATRAPHIRYLSRPSRCWGFPGVHYGRCGASLMYSRKLFALLLFKLAPDGNIATVLTKSSAELRNRGRN